MLKPRAVLKHETVVAPTGCVKRSRGPEAAPATRSVSRDERRRVKKSDGDAPAATTVPCSRPRPVPALDTLHGTGALAERLLLW